MNDFDIVEVLSVTAMGIIVVFAVLIILMIVLNFMKIFSKEKSVSRKENIKTEEIKVSKNIEADNHDEEEFIAVLTAAVASAINTPVYYLKIKSYKRLS